MFLFVCVEVLWPSQPNVIMLSSVSLPNHTFTGQALSSKGYISIVHILLPEIDNFALLESVEGTQGQYKIFLDQSLQKKVADPARVDPATS